MSRSEEQAGEVEVILVGGPADIPETSRTLRLREPADNRIKLARLGGYERFERVDETAERDPAVPLVFRWTMRTKIAE